MNYLEKKKLKITFYDPFINELKVQRFKKKIKSKKNLMGLFYQFLIKKYY